MGKILDLFFDGAPRFMRLGFLGFVVTVIGVGFGFSIDYGPDNPLSYIAFGIVVTGVVIGFVAVVWGLISRKPYN